MTTQLSIFGWTYDEQTVERPPQRCDGAEAAVLCDLLQVVISKLQVPARRFEPHLFDIVGRRNAELARERPREVARLMPTRSARAGTLKSALG